ncbi:unnamed protein product [Protopolystoma xenopodis]|uniref:Uncharacterized protein n=1 Tax=Protopolystoma xenopodis TaxID=117903 RepID=A0A3S5FFG7_9PLAT|nr:unnamed protein product [Protopolystoma xenopodis]
MCACRPVKLSDFVAPCWPRRGRLKYAQTSSVGASFQAVSCQEASRSGAHQSHALGDRFRDLSGPHCDGHRERLEVRGFCFGQSRLKPLLSCVCVCVIVGIVHFWYQMVVITK